MTAKAAVEIQGVEYDWLASDAEGCVALFSTAGSGFAPEEYLRDTDAHDAAIEAILASPATTTARFAPALRDGFENTWRLVAERGLFAFDGGLSSGSYEPAAAPTAPVALAALREATGVGAVLVPLPHLRFRALTRVTEALLRGPSR